MKTWLTIVTVAVFGWLAADAFDLAGAQQTVDRDYIIGPGDKLQIQVWDNEDLNREIEVAQDGTFSFPFIGKVETAGKSVFMLEKHLIQLLSDGYLVSPQVTISITEYLNKKAFLFGEVARPGSYVLRKNMHLLELISDAGGFTDARGATGTIIRAIGDVKDDQPISLANAAQHEVIHVNLLRLTAGDAAENITIRPNDSIYIATTDRVYVTGEVIKPGEVLYSEGMTVRQAISIAGGGTPKASIGRTRIIRMTDGKEIEIKPNLGDAVYPEDIIKVPESFF
jgi:polysaccharide export outer membrane protein